MDERQTLAELRRNAIAAAAVLCVIGEAIFMTLQDQNSLYSPTMAQVCAIDPVHC